MTGSEGLPAWLRSGRAALSGAEPPAQTLESALPVSRGRDR
jgi:hypothetical protein